MANKYNSEGRVPSNYPGLFNARENRMITHNYSLVELAPSAAPESFEIKSDDNVTHVSVDASSQNVTLVFPKPELSKGRVIKVYVIDSTSTVLIEEKDGTDIAADAAAGSYEYFCTGSEYKRVF